MNKNLEILYELTEEFMNSLFLKAEEIYLYENLSEEFDLGLRSMLGKQNGRQRHLPYSRKYGILAKGIQPLERYMNNGETKCF